MGSLNVGNLLVDSLVLVDRLQYLSHLLPIVSKRITGKARQVRCIAIRDKNQPFILQ